MNHFEHGLNLNYFFFFPLKKIITWECISSNVNFIKRQKQPANENSAAPRALNINLPKLRSLSSVYYSFTHPYFVSFICTFIFKYTFNYYMRNKIHCHCQHFALAYVCVCFFSVSARTITFLLLSCCKRKKEIWKIIKQKPTHQHCFA